MGLFFSVMWLKERQKKDFVSYIRETVFAPIEMKSTFADDNQKIIPNRSRFYSKGAGKKPVNEMFTDNSDRIGAGGFISSSGDLVRFGSAMLKNDLLTDETRELIFRSQKTKDGKETGVGLGWRIGKDNKERKIYLTMAELPQVDVLF